MKKTENMTIEKVEGKAFKCNIRKDAEVKELGLCITPSNVLVETVTNFNKVSISTPRSGIKEMKAKNPEVEEKDLEFFRMKFESEKRFTLATLQAEIDSLIELENKAIREQEYFNCLQTEYPVATLCKKGMVPQLKLRKLSKKDEPVEWEIDGSYEVQVDVQEFFKYVEVEGVDDLLHKGYNATWRYLDALCYFLGMKAKKALEDETFFVPEKYTGMEFEYVSSAKGATSTRTLIGILHQVLDLLLGKEVMDNFKVFSADVEWLYLTCFRPSKKNLGTLIMPTRKTTIPELTTVAYKILNGYKFKIAEAK